MNHPEIQQQANMIAQHNGAILQQLQQLALHIQAMSIDAQQKQQNIILIQQLAMSIKGLNQETIGLIQNMGMMIDNLEQQRQMQYQQQPYTSQPAYAQPVVVNSYAPAPVVYGGGGFWGNLVAGMEFGAGMAIADVIVDDMFIGDGMFMGDVGPW